MYRQVDISDCLLTTKVQKQHQQKETRKSKNKIKL